MRSSIGVKSVYSDARPTEPIEVVGVYVGAGNLEHAG
jgi:hypothetical protein